MKWVHRLFLTLTLAPMILWATGFALLLFLGFGVGCHIEAGFQRPCMFMGRDIADQAQHIGVLVAWGPLIVGPAMLASGIAWGVVTLTVRLWRRVR